MKQVNFKIVLCGILIGLTGCASQPKPIAPIVGAEKIEKMERDRKSTRLNSSH